MRDDSNNILYEKVLSKQYSYNIKFFNLKGIKTNSHPTYGLKNYLLNVKIESHPEYATVAQLTSWTNKK